MREQRELTRDGEPTLNQLKKDYDKALEIINKQAIMIGDRYTRLESERMIKDSHNKGICTNCIFAREKKKDDCSHPYCGTDGPRAKTCSMFRLEGRVDSENHG